MDNLKYFEDGLAYDFNLFAQPEPKKKSNIIEIPAQRSARAKHRSRAAGFMAGKASAVLVELEQKVSYKNLETSAKELGMKKMDKSQIVYVRTHQADKAVVGEQNTNTAAHN